MADGREGLWRVLGAWETVLELSYAADRVALPESAGTGRRGLAAPTLYTPESGLGGLSPACAFAVRTAAPVVDASATDDLFPLD